MLTLIDTIYDQAKKIGAKIIIIGEIYSHIPKNFSLKVEDLPSVSFGHFYSLYADINDIEERYEQNIDMEISDNKYIDGIDINEEKQIELLQKMNSLYESRPKWELNEKVYRYKCGNTSIGLSDTFLINFMLRIYKPKKYIEVGSGYSSAAALDTNEYYLDGKTQMEFIEPYPDLLYSLLKESDKEKVAIHPQKLQDISLEVFKNLHNGDILFIDSTHVSKSGSDVNYLFFHILPCLESGVLVHLHDIFYPWDYPKEWIKKNGWNEMYLLRAFLQYNSEWDIIFFNHYMAEKHKDLYHQEWRKQSDLGGGSFWMRKK